MNDWYGRQYRDWERLTREDLKICERRDMVAGGLGGGVDAVDRSGEEGGI